MPVSSRPPDPERLRTMAKDSQDPIIRRALRDLADEYERMREERMHELVA